LFIVPTVTHLAASFAAAPPATASAIWTLGRVFAMMAGIFFAGLVILFIVLDIWGKYAVRGKADAIFFEERSIWGRLLPIDTTKTEERIHLSKGENQEDYLLQADRMFLTLWPAFLPRPLQQPVRTWVFVRGNPEPIDPSNVKLTITSKSLRIMSDEALLKSTWKDMREAVGLAQRKSPVFLLFLAILANVGISAIVLLEVLSLVKKFH